VKRTLLVLAAILTALAFGLTVLITSDGALRWVFARIAALAPGELRVETLQGNLLGPIHARDIVYRDTHTDLHIGELVLDWQPAALLRATFRITRLDVEDVQLHRRSAPAGTASPPRFVLPMRVELDAARLTHAALSLDKGEPVTLVRAELRGHGLGTSLRLEKLELEAERYAISSSGSLELKPPYRVDLDLHWSVHAPSLAPVSGHGWVRGDSRELVTEQQLAPPWGTRLKGTVSDVFGISRWQATLTTDGLNPAAIQKSWPVAALRAELDAEGDLRHLAAHGRIGVSHAGQVLDGEVRVRAAESGVTLETLTLRERDGEAMATVLGTWQPGATEPLALKGTWKSLRWPLTDTLQALSPRGHLTFDGSFQHYRLGLDGMLELAGSVRTRSLHVTGDLTAAGEQYTLQGFSLSAGQAKLTASGSVNQRWALAWQLTAPNLGEALPDASGQVTASGRLSGARQQPMIGMQISARDFAWRDNRMAKLDSTLELDLADQTDSQLTWQSDGLRVRDIVLDRLEFMAHGRRRDHQLSTSLRSADMDARLQASGGLTDRRWRGSLLGSEYGNSRIGRWHQREAATIEIGGDAFALAPLCLDQETHHVCVNGAWRQKQGGQASVQLAGAPLALLELLIGEAQFEGRVDGQSHLTVKANGDLDGELDLATGAGTVQLGDATSAIGFDQISFKATAAADRLQMKAALTLTKAGTAQAELAMPFAPFKAGPAGDQGLRGMLRAQLNELEWLTLFVPELLQPRGRLQLQAELGGRVEQPEVRGEATLEAGRAGIAGLGITFEDVRASVRSDGTRRMIVQAEGRSGPGTLKIDGHVELGTETPWRAQLQLQGQEVEAIHLPEYTLTGSPDMRFKIQPRALELEGTMNVTRALVAPRALRAGVKSSPDVVVLGAGPEAREERTAVTANVRVILGKQVRVTTYNVDAFVEGDMTLYDKPGQPTTASGELRVERGTYRAYGKDLDIDRGRLIFTGGPVDDPDVDLRAVRRVENVTAGIQARGRLQKPEVTLFSEPPLDQTNILSYIVFGTSAQQSGSAENAWLAQAVSALALATGEGVMRGVGGAIGIEDVRIASGAGGSTSVMLGTYLSPRLYVSYGIGLFETGNSLRLRYDLSEHWQIQTDTGKNTGADILYKIER
jgi:translocation and assembly module TamB